MLESEPCRLAKNHFYFMGNVKLVVFLTILQNNMYDYNIDIYTCTHIYMHACTCIHKENRFINTTF